MFEYTLLDNLAEEIQIPEAGITSKKVFESERLKAVVFAFAEGETMDEHTAAVPAMVHVLKGETEFAFEDDVKHLKEGAWVHMDAKLPHSVVAKTPLVIVVYLLRNQK